MIKWQNNKITVPGKEERTQKKKKRREVPENRKRTWTEAFAWTPCSLVTASSLWMGSLSWLYEKSYYLHYQRLLSSLSLPPSVTGYRAASSFGGSCRTITVRMEDGRESIFLTGSSALAALERTNSRYVVRSHDKPDEAKQGLHMPERMDRSMPCDN